jgi:predicted secreted protein
MRSCEAARASPGTRYHGRAILRQTVSAGKPLFAAASSPVPRHHYPAPPPQGRAQTASDLAVAAVSRCTARDTLTLQAAYNAKEITLQEGQILTIRLQANPSTGYTWEVADSGGAFLRQAGETELQADSGLPSAPRKQTLRFEAVGRGQTELRPVYHRPWEADVERLETFTVQLAVQYTRLTSWTAAAGCPSGYTKWKSDVSGYSGGLSHTLHPSKKPRVRTRNEASAIRARRPRSPG